MKENGRYYYVWGGQFHNIPRGFVLPPTMNLHTLITYWFVGSEHPVVPTLKYVKPFDFEEKKRSSMQVLLSQMKKLMSGVLAAARIESFNPGNRGENIKTAEDASFVFNKVRVYFDFQSGGHHKRRLNAFTWKTVSNLYKKINTNLRMRNHCL